MKRLLGADGTNRRPVLATQAPLDATLQVDMSDILDALGLRLLCCRLHLTTALDFRDYY